ncbi:perforin 1.3 precursor [Silurus asotus]|uniref:Perforin 1.3 n=1 Tax=Silurus asotus TaxID=30991 RepID=A0AAD5A3G7_SILAS|nr:perforin 1.3 precursor [Silurus asotus]
MMFSCVSSSSCCRTAPITECADPPFVPGHNLVGEGFDIVRMKTTGAFVVNVQDYITGGVHGNCTICKNSLLGREEKLPSAVTDWRVKVNCKRSVSAQVFESTSSVLKESTSSTSIGWKVGLGLPMVAGVAIGGTHSKSAKFARSHASQDKFFYTSHKFSCRYYTGVEVKGQTSYCKSKGKKLENQKGFSASFSDRITEVWGGKEASADLLFSPDKQHGYNMWLKTLQSVPGVVSYSLTALHMLVMNDSARRAALQKAIREYVMKNAVSSSCSRSCKVGHRGPDCVCKCSGHQSINSNCCPTHLGIATMNVTVVRATGLWGDYFSKTDGYVKVFYKDKGDETPIIWNNDFPVWTYLFKFGTVNLEEKKPVTFQVWDRDNKWDDDLLGSFKVFPKSGINVPHQLKLKHGTLYVSISAVCGPSLQGAVCERYAPSPGAEEILTYSELFQNRHQTWIGQNYGTGMAKNITRL